jgi:phosphate transport system permease protein
MDVRSALAAGDAVSGEVDLVLEGAALRYRALRLNASRGLWIALLTLSLAGITWGWRRISPRFRAINSVERVFKALLLAASMVAILTTVGIVLSLLFESVRFFGSPQL